MLECLCTHWDAGLYRSGGSSETQTEGVEPDKVTEALQCNRFLAYIDMVMILQKSLKRLEAWAEACPCHWHLTRLNLNKKNRRKAKLIMRECKCSGRRAPELAAGCIGATIEEISNESWNLLVREWRGRLSEEDWEVVASDFQTAKDVLGTSLSNLISGFAYRGNCAG